MMITSRCRMGYRPPLLLLSLIGALLLAPFQLAPRIAQANSPPAMFTPTRPAVLRETTYQSSWGDYDADGDLDLAVANRGWPGRVYTNDRGVMTLAWSTAATAFEGYGVAWGDYDGDGDLDLVFAIDASGTNPKPPWVYRNDGGAQFTPVWTFPDHAARVAAWGDYDNDGDLDLAIGTHGARIHLYRNDGGSFAEAWVSLEMRRFTFSLAWGDYDADGDLDLVIGTTDWNLLYRNDGGQFTRVWTATEAGPTYAVAWGDIDGDGDLDLAVGNDGSPSAVGGDGGSPDRLYRNDAGQLTLIWSGTIYDATRGMAWGDYDGDGDLDLAIGNNNQPTRLYRNDGGALALAWESLESLTTTSLTWGDSDGDGDQDLLVDTRGQGTVIYQNNTSQFTQTYGLASPGRTTSVAWGDYDGDGDLDLAAGNEGAANEIFQNNAGALTRFTLPGEPATTRSVAWGDYDGDGDLDLAAGNDGAASRLYRNTAGVFALDPQWAPAPAPTRSLHWGDFDQDGDLDLLLVNYGQAMQLYRNEGGLLQLHWTPTQVSRSVSAAWGDYDQDGDLDLAVANDASVLWVFTNLGGVFAPIPWRSTEIDAARSLAWGDYDGDGDLDLAVGNENRPNRIYRNDEGQFRSAWESAEPDTTKHIAWGDYDGDGDLDLAVANYEQPNRIYRNEGGTLLPGAAWSAPVAVKSKSFSVAWGDYDQDGDLDLAAGGAETVPGEDVRLRIYRNGPTQGARPITTPPQLRLAVAGLPETDGYGQARVYTGSVPLQVTVADPEGDPVRRVDIFYSPDGGGRWLPAVQRAGDAPLRDLATGCPGGCSYPYVWDSFASGLFGASDMVVLRAVAYPITSSAPSVAPAFRRGSVSTTTRPFRVQGTQVQVVDTQGAPVAGAYVYRTAGAGYQVGARFPAVAPGKPGLNTNAQGFLQGRGTLTLGDRLVALAPLTETLSFSLYHTSAPVSDDGLLMADVEALGVQRLTVDPANPLLVFHLTVALEWDVRADQPFVNQLRRDLERASELLFRWSNGQIALGRITIYQNREHWNDAHIRVYASNRLRPNANKGGIVPAEIRDPNAAVLDPYVPGQIRMGAVWNRYGQASTNLGEDWPRTLAHEIGHFALFLDDNYIGLDENGQLISVDGCPGVMADPYIENAFHPDAGWLPGCAATLSQRITGRSDWATIQAFYTLAGLNFQLKAPGSYGAAPQPLRLPLALTEVTLAPLAAELEPGSAPISAPIFLTVDSAGARALPGPNARAVLFQPGPGAGGAGGFAVDLGSPTADQVLARGARPADRLCVYDPDFTR